MAHMTALDDAAWQGPWRRVRVGEKVVLSVALLTTALVAPPWPGCALVAMACLVLICGPAHVPPRTLRLAMAAQCCSVALVQKMASSWLMPRPASSSCRL